MALGDHLTCYTCGGVAAVAGDFDLVTERDEWPALPCEATAGCTGSLTPELPN